MEGGEGESVCMSYRQETKDSERICDVSYCIQSVTGGTDQTSGGCSLC